KEEWGNEEVKTPYRFSVFPNPGYGEFTVQVSGTLSSDAELIIYDAHGRVVKKRFKPETTNLENPQIRLNLEDLKPGNYILKLRSNQYADSQKLVIVR
ncbi:MAG TPA: hypothetical protein DIW27_04100, partial [Cytophagales bacterium]|nr:hypothetical protein [Cytophagales bacterium]